MGGSGTGTGQVVGRFAPSPSGRMHLGNVLSALIAWGSARSQGGSFLLRLEDLDERCRQHGAAELLLDDLRWLGLDWDGEALSQESAGTKRYDDAFGLLEARRLVYPCYCSRADLHAASAPHASDGTPLYAGTCRGLSAAERSRRDAELRGRTGHGPAFRLRVPPRTYAFADALYGFQEQDLAAGCGDFVVCRSDGVYAYQLVVVVDDARAGVTEVVRGNDLLGSTPRQLYLHELLGLPQPAYAHHPMLVDAQHRRLSKRDKDCDMGYIRERASAQQVVGWLAGLVDIQDGGEPLSAAEFQEAFSWSKLRTDDVVVDGTPWD